MPAGASSCSGAVLFFSTIAPGNGAFGTGSLTASRTSSQAFLAPGTEPLTKIRPRVGVGADDFEVLLGALLVAHVAGHLLVLEDLARILALTGRTERTVADRDAVGGAHAAEAPALHARPGKALALGVAGDVDHLAGDEVLGADRRADREQRVLASTRNSATRFLSGTCGLGEMLTLRLGDVLLLGLARAELDGDIAVTLVGAVPKPPGNLPAPGR